MATVQCGRCPAGSTVSGDWHLPSSPIGRACADIEACLSAQSAKLYHMGLREPVRRSTLADANETRDWRIYAEFAQRLHREGPGGLYADDDLDVDLLQARSECARLNDHRSVSVGVSMGAFSFDQSCGEDAHAACPSRQHTKLHPYFRRQTASMFKPRTRCARFRAWCHLRHGSGLYVDFGRLHVLHEKSAHSSVTRAKSNLDAHRVYSAPADRSSGVLCDQTSLRWTATSHQRRYPAQFCAASDP